MGVGTGVPASVEGTLFGHGEGGTSKAACLRGIEERGGVVEDRPGVVRMGKELPQARSPGGPAIRVLGKESFQVRGSEGCPGGVTPGMGVEGQVPDGVEAHLDGLQAVGSQPQLFGVLALTSSAAAKLATVATVGQGRLRCGVPGGWLLWFLRCLRVP